MEMRARQRYMRAGMECPCVPSDKEVLNEFSTCILREPVGSPIDMPGLSDSFREGIPDIPYMWDANVESGSVRRSWPLGPTSGLSGGSVWPYIFMSNTNDYSVHAREDRLWFCAVIAIQDPATVSPTTPLLSFPEITAGYKLLRDLARMLPASSTGPQVARFLFFLKMAIPFGSPVVTDISVLEQIQSADFASLDPVVIAQPVNQSCHRVPAWNPVPGQTLSHHQSPSAAITTTATITVVEKLSFDFGPENTSSIAGQIICSSDIPGTPELILPITFPEAPVISVDGSTRMTEDERGLVKLSLVPKSDKFCFSTYRYPTFDITDSFPITSASFSLYQISQSRFKFRLDAKLKILFNHFFVKFAVSSNPEIRPITIHTVDISPRTRVDISPEEEVVWTFKTPGTYSEHGEFVEGLVEIPQDVVLGECDSISDSAFCYFGVLGKNCSSLEIDRRNITIFPNSNKYQVNVNYELKSAEKRCFIHNTSSDSKPPTRTTTRSVSQLVSVA